MVEEEQRPGDAHDHEDHDHEGETTGAVALLAGVSEIEIAQLRADIARVTSPLLLLAMVAVALSTLDTPTSLVPAASTGTTACAAGKIVCMGQVLPMPNVCDKPPTDCSGMMHADPTMDLIVQAAQDILRRLAVVVLNEFQTDAGRLVRGTIVALHEKPARVLEHPRFDDHHLFEFGWQEFHFIP